MSLWASCYPKLARPLLLIVVMLPLLIAPLFQPTTTLAQSGTTHTVQGGENLFRIALRYNTTVEALAAANGITDPTRVYAGQVLIIPDGTAPVVNTAAVDQPPAADPAVVQQAAPAVSTGPVYHTVQGGETLASIGRLYGLSWTDIATANGIVNPSYIYAGQQILIPGASAPGTAAVAPPVVEQVPAQTAPVEVVQPTQPAPVVEAAQPVQVVTGVQQTHVVQAGESLASIGRIYGISWPAIARANGISDPNHIYGGQVLTIPAVDDGQGGYLQPASYSPSSVAAPTVTSGKQIVVDLSDQATYAYENGALLRSVTVSTGMWGTPTVQGDYQVYVKYTSQTMSGPGYYLPGVPYVMYFYQGYSLHGTYWHSNFGTPMSHGCVNMPTPEAEWFFNWAEVGTPVHVQW